MVLIEVGFWIAVAFDGAVVLLIAWRVFKARNE